MPDVNRRVKPPAQEWLMLAFPLPALGEDDEFPVNGFRLAKSGKCWFLKLPTREAAIAVKRELVANNIEYACKKVRNNQQRSSSGRWNPRRKAAETLFS